MRVGFYLTYDAYIQSYTTKHSKLVPGDGDDTALSKNQCKARQ